MLTRGRKGTVKRTKKSTFGGVALAAVALAAAAGGTYIMTTANADQGSAPAPAPLRNHDPRVRGTLLGLFSGSATRYAAREESVRRCMEQRGFTYVRNPAPKADVAPTLGQDPYGLTEAQVKETGYGSAEDVNDSPGEVDRSDASQQEGWGRAYFGPEDAPEVTVDLPGGGTIGTTSQGCLAEARKKLYGSLEDYVVTNFLAGNLPIWARKEAASDADMARIDSMWSSCMTGKGYTNFKNPGAARAKSSDEYQRLGVASDSARDQEISVAVADAECEQQTNYAKQRIQLEDRYYAKILKQYAEEVENIQKVNDRALVQAKQVLKTQ